MSTAVETQIKSNSVEHKYGADEDDFGPLKVEVEVPAKKPAPKNGAASSSSIRLATPAQTAALAKKPVAAPLDSITLPKIQATEVEASEVEGAEAEAEPTSQSQTQSQFQEAPTSQPPAVESVGEGEVAKPFFTTSTVPIPESKPKKSTKEKEEEEEEEEKIVQLPGLVQQQKDGLLIVEMVAKDGMLLFATNKSDDLEESLPRGKGKKKEKIMPPLSLKSFIEAGSLRLPKRGLSDRRDFTAETLIKEIKKFIKNWVDMPEEWLTPIATYVLMTWVYDRFRVVPYLRFLGEPDTGKTTILQVVAALCYRSLTVSGNVTGAALFHSIDLIRGTLALDEGDFKNSDEQSDIIKILNNGYTSGLPVVRNQSQGKNYTPQPFVVYGPKIITTRKRFEDPATESRCLTFETQERKVPAHIPLQLNEKFETDARVLRNKLLGWRFDNFKKIKVDDSMPRKAGLNSRMAQMGTSLLAVAPESEKGAIVSFLKGYAEGAKEDNHREIVRQILEEAFAPRQAPAGDVRETFGAGAGVDVDERGEVPIARITVITNERLKGSGSNELTHKTIGSLVRSLGYQTRRKTAGYVVERKE